MRVIVTHVLVAITKMVPFNAQNNPMYEVGAIVMLFYTRGEGGLSFGKGGKASKWGGGSLSWCSQHITNSPIQSPGPAHQANIPEREGVKASEEKVKRSSLRESRLPGLRVSLLLRRQYWWALWAPGPSGSTRVGSGGPGLSTQGFAAAETRASALTLAPLHPPPHSPPNCCPGPPSLGPCSSW